MKKVIALLLFCLLLFGCSNTKEDNLKIINNTNNEIKSIAYNVDGNPIGFSHTDGSALNIGEDFEDYVEEPEINFIITDINNNIFNTDTYKLKLQKLNCFTISKSNNTYEVKKGCNNE